MGSEILTAIHLAVMSASLKLKVAQRADCLGCSTMRGVLTGA